MGNFEPQRMHVTSTGKIFVMDDKYTGSGEAAPARRNVIPLKAQGHTDNGTRKIELSLYLCLKLLA